MKRVRRREHVRKRVRVGAPDPSLTATSGVAAFAEFLTRLDVVATFDRGIGPIKQRERGATAGELLVGLAQSQLLGGDALVALDRQRADVAATELSAVPAIPATTAGSLARRFGAEQFAGVESANAELVARAVGLLPAPRRAKLHTALTIDMDSTDVEVYGSAKQGVAYNYVVEVEAWFRRRTDIEDRIREAKLGAALRHLPSGHAGVNTVWTWAALLAGNLSVLLQALTRIDDNGRAHGGRLRQTAVRSCPAGPPRPSPQGVSDGLCKRWV